MALFGRRRREEAERLAAAERAQQEAQQARRQAMAERRAKQRDEMRKGRSRLNLTDMVTASRDPVTRNSARKTEIGREMAQLDAASDAMQKLIDELNRYDKALTDKPVPVDDVVADLMRLAKETSTDT